MQNKSSKNKVVDFKEVQQKQNLGLADEKYYNLKLRRMEYASFDAPMMYLGQINGELDLFLDLTCDSLEEGLRYLSTVNIFKFYKAVDLKGNKLNCSPIRVVSEKEPQLNIGLVLSLNDEGYYNVHNANMHHFVRAKKAATLLNKYLENEQSEYAIILCEHVIKQLYLVAVEGVYDTVFNGIEVKSKKASEVIEKEGLKLVAQMQKDKKNLSVEQFVDKWQDKAVVWRTYMQKKISSADDACEKTLMPKNVKNKDSFEK